MSPLSRMLIARVSALALFGVLVPIAANASSILINGSFELHSADMPGSGELLGGSTQVTGWIVTGSSNANNVIDWLGPGGGGPQWNASDGTHLVDLDGRDALNGGLFQTFATTVGQHYTVSFDLSGNPGDAPGNGLPRVKQVRVAVGAFTQDYQFDSTGLTTVTLRWQPIAFLFIASAASETLSFTSLTPTANSYGPLIDNVSISPTTTPVPEPSALLLLGSGLASAGVRRWQRRGEA